MRLSEIGELSLLRDIRRRFSTKAKALKVGIGDDAAVIAPGKGDLVITTDMMMEGVHFNASFTTPFQLGFKLISVNVSDIYAMAGTPCYGLLNIGLRPDTSASFLRKLLDGVKDACDLYKLSIIGGDLSSSKRDIAVSATILGNIQRPLRRCGASPGERIYVTGCLGDSAAGFLLLREINKAVDFKRPQNKPLKWHIMKPLLKRHLMPLIKEPGPFKNHATSMLDISDGLLIDLTRLSDEGRVGVKIYEEKIPISDNLRQAASYLGIDPLRLALTGGEDYELLFTAPAVRKVNAQCIGEVTKSGRVFVDKRGRTRPIKPEGYEHFKAEG